jgi:hypothetical protein
MKLKLVTTNIIAVDIGKGHREAVVDMKQCEWSGVLNRALQGTMLKPTASCLQS